MSIASSKATQANNITLYYITTREPEEFSKIDPLNPNFKSEVRQGYGGDKYQDFINLKQQPACNSGSIVVFVHGWEESEKNVEERLNRVKLSLENNNYTGPLIGFSWPSDTVWLGAEFIAKANGPKLAKLIYDIKSECPAADVRIIAHSLGARVVLSSLDSLHDNPLWYKTNFQIKSIHLLGAAVDDEEVSNRSEFITIDPTNWGSPKSDYGQAIEAEVTNFTNLFSSKDNLLRPNLNPALAIYPTFESDLALGQSGYQKNNILNQYDIKNSTALPKNYNEINVTGELLANCDADGDRVPDIAICDFIPMTTGENHRGYLGYRNSVTKLITNDGAINVVISNWNNKPDN
ncbi:MAG: alpha/beta hydrolase [Nitrososphaeraceae archaeon]